MRNSSYTPWWILFIPIHSDQHYMEMTVKTGFCDAASFTWVIGASVSYRHISSFTELMHFCTDRKSTRLNLQHPKIPSLWSSSCHVGHCVWVWTKSINRCRRSCTHKISPLYMLYSKKMTKSHNSCKTCSTPKSRLYSHLHVMFVTVYGYEQNPSRSVGGVAHTRFREVRTDIHTEQCKSKCPQNRGWEA